MNDVNEPVRYQLLDDVALLTVDNPPVNALSHGVRRGLKENLARALADPEVAAVVLYCEGRTFIAGADISEFGHPVVEPDLRQLLDALDMADKPIVAAIHGTALGGGLETALCCHYRVALDIAKFGLPEVQLGLLPGAGGTQRLPRIIGPEKALIMMTTGVPISAGEAHKLGLVDQLVNDDLLSNTLIFIREKVARGQHHSRVRDKQEKLLDVAPEIFQQARHSTTHKMRGFLAPEYNIRCVEAAVTQSFDQGCQTEAELFAELMAGPQSEAQRYFFFAERQAAKVPNIDVNRSKRPIAKVGVIGGGLMGGGIAMNMANAGIPVTIVETSSEALQRGLNTIRKNYESTVRKGRISDSVMQQRYALITGAIDLNALADCDLIIEAVFENMAVKKELFARLDGLAKAGAILASNTSALNLNDIAAVTQRPESVIGLHFFSPAHIMKLLEIVRCEKTADDVIATCMAFSKRIAKVPVLVGVCPGFVGNRILAVRQQQAARLALEGASIEAIDRVLYDFGFPMGAFQMADLAGLDIGWDSDNCDPSDIRDRLCELGRLGQKTQAGFYDYDDRRRPTPATLVSEVIADCAVLKGVHRRDASDSDILDRCLLPMINEGAKILDEGIAGRASDIDVVYVYGYGWPRYRGGPMHYANSVGLSKVVEKLRKLQSTTGDIFWEPSPFLVNLAERGQRF